MSGKGQFGKRGNSAICPGRAFWQVIGRLSRFREIAPFRQKGCFRGGGGSGKRGGGSRERGRIVPTHPPTLHGLFTQALRPFAAAQGMAEHRCPAEQDAERPCSESKAAEQACAKAGYGAEGRRSGRQSYAAPRSKEAENGKSGGESANESGRADRSGRVGGTRKEAVSDCRRGRRKNSEQRMRSAKRIYATRAVMLNLKVGYMRHFRVLYLWGAKQSRDAAPTTQAGEEAREVKYAQAKAPAADR